jgi:hypothetical protein
LSQTRRWLDALRDSINQGHLGPFEKVLHESATSLIKNGADEFCLFLALPVGFRRRPRGIIEPSWRKNGRVRGVWM